MLKNTARVQENAKKYKAGATYPQTKFAGQLREAARLIAAGVGQRVLYVSLGVLTPTPGSAPSRTTCWRPWRGLAAFQTDLERQGVAGDVIVMGFSEFGRRVAENGSAGTDHGKGSVMFALGQGVKGGIHGSSPDLEKLSDGDIIYKQDFRGVYAEALTKWLGLNAREILGGSFTGPSWIAS
ncbi:DUF1501 domain-containing protein [Deinococcus multiflagellatus]|uniref:DUF1501 domain-containing protein n=1 Tax=Deinococcus multiflagellatus TaxID=1656887 RepID=A0ABW1ZPC6_9DEIO